jgi:hypothetical protein
MAAASLLGRLAGEVRAWIMATGNVGYAAESGTFGNASGTNTMSDTVTVDPATKGAATVSASALARHIDCSRAYVGKLEADG